MSYQLPPSLLFFEGPDVYSIQRLEISSPKKSSVLTEGTASFSFKLKNGVSFPNPYLFSLKTFLKLLFSSPKKLKKPHFTSQLPQINSKPP